MSHKCDKCDAPLVRNCIETVAGLFICIKCYKEQLEKVGQRGRVHSLDDDGKMVSAPAVVFDFMAEKELPSVDWVKPLIGIKADAGKALVMRGALRQFPRALESIARVSEFGAKKYTWDGWRTVDDGLERYGNALARHLLAQARGEVTDPESGHKHAAHVAWNALVVLELILTKEENENHSHPA